MRILVFQHVAFEGLGAIQPWIESRGHSVTYTRFFAGELPPSVASYNWLIILGGPMGVHDAADHAWLNSEKAAILEAIAAHKVILGICLGAQLLALTLGAEVKANSYREIGWHKIQFTRQNHWTSAENIKTFHWHGDTFTLPPEALHLASSEACQNQGFIWKDKVLGLQFHPEATPESIDTLITNCAGDLRPGPFVQSLENLKGRTEDFAVNHAYLGRMLLRLEANGISPSP